MTRIASHARWIGSTASRVLRSSPGGTVAATFSRSGYLALEAGIVALVEPDLLNGPLNVVLDSTGTFPFPDLPAGQAVQIELDAILIGDGIRVETAGARVWPAQLRPWSLEEARRAGDRLDAIDAVLTEAPKESLARVEGRPRRAASAMFRLSDGIGRRDSRIVEEAATQLAGLGPGLTPSGDDVLAGAMIAMTLIPPGGIPALRAVILRAAAGRTGRVSAAYLATASRGEAGEAWHWLRNAISAAADHPPYPALETAARRLLAFGETSGADMLAGFVLALRALGAR